MEPVTGKRITADWAPLCFDVNAGRARANEIRKQIDERDARKTARRRSQQAAAQPCGRKENDTTGSLRRKLAPLWGWGGAFFEGQRHA